MNSMRVFNYRESAVRTVEKGGEPWFVLKDVCGVLSIANSADVSSRLDNDEKGVGQIDTPGGMQNVTLINESGLYNVILRSDKPEAKPFRRWVTREVLPTIRRTGTYTTSPDPTKAALAEAKVRNSRAREASVWLKIAKEVSAPSYKEICAHYASTVLAGKEVLPLPAVAEKTYTAAQVGEMLGVSANKIGRTANAHGLKTPEYGIEVWDKSPNSAKQVPTWRYNNKGIEKLRELIKGEETA